MNSRIYIVATGLLLSLPLGLCAQGLPAEQDDPSVTASQRWLQDYYSRQAASYEFFYDEAHQIPLKFVDKPVFRWKQDDDWSGDLFVWTHQGRPEIVGCILASSPNDGSRGVAHEFHSLASDGLPREKMVNGGIWQPKSGLKMSPLAGVDQPAKAAPLRLSQMRDLARSFTAVMKHDDKDWELRYLPQPIYRYASPERRIIDGALFAYVWSRGTDPEMLMLLECRDEQTGPRWYYSPLNFTSRPIRLNRNDVEVWTTAGGGGWVTGESTRVYETFYAGSVVVPTDKK